MTEQQRQQTYDHAWNGFKADHSADYRFEWDRCLHAQRQIAAEVEAGRPWSDLADTYRWTYDQAMTAITQLDRQACDAAEAALATVEAIEQLDAWVDRRNQRNQEAGAHLPSIGKADVA